MYVDYDMQNTYLLLNEISKKVKKTINDDETMILKLPLAIGTNNTFLVNLGPKVTIKIAYINSVLTNVYTKITNYGLNNALVEAYIKITIDGQIITPVTTNKASIEYDMLISSKVINGRVPEFYGGYLTTNSSILDIPIKN